MSTYEADKYFQAAQAKSIDVQDYMAKLKLKPNQDQDFVLAMISLGQAVNALATGMRELAKR